MRIIILGFVLMLFSASKSQVQVVGNEQKNNTNCLNQIGLIQGEVLCPNSFKLKNPLFKKPFFLLDNGTEIDTRDVSFYKNKDGYFKYFPLINNRVAMEREVEGKICVYKNISYSGGGYIPTGGYGGGMMMGGGGTSITYYYEKENGDFNRLKYYYLSEDLKGCKSCKIHLNKVKNIRVASTVFYVTGVALIGGALLVFSNGGAEEATIPMLIGGGLCLWIPSFFSGSKNRHMKNAVRAYNKEME